MADMKRAALGYATRLGVKIFPVGPDCRIPYAEAGLVEHGCHDATNDPELIDRLWSRWPDANIAMATGLASGVVVLDVDSKENVDGLASLERLQADYSPLPETWQAFRHNGGMHLFFNPRGRKLRNRVNLSVGWGDDKVRYPGLDVRADGGSVAVSPSRKPDGAYAWLRHPLSTPLAVLPDWLANIIDPPEPPRPPVKPVRFSSIDRVQRYVEAAVDAECRRVATMAANTGRNQQLFQSACNLFGLVAGGVLPEDLAVSRLEAAAHDCGLVKDDGWHAVRQTIASGKRRGMQNPREVAA